MLAAVQLDGKRSGAAIKVQNVGLYDFLACEPWDISAQKIVSQMPFFFGHVMAELTGTGNHFLGLGHGGLLF